MSQGFECNVDLVLCIDATGSMGPVIGKVKESALSFYDSLVTALASKDRIVNEDNFRVKVIVFRDYYCDGDDSMEESAFFKLPTEKSAFRSFVSSIEAKGGGDEPENALEAIAIAMNSDWVQQGTRKRHIIMVWTDATAHPLEKSQEGKPSNYPSDIPDSFMELAGWWEDTQSGKMNNSAKRLIVFAPDDAPWSDVAMWSQTIHMASKAGDGLADTDMDIVFDVLAGSI